MQPVRRLCVWLVFATAIGMLPALSTRSEERRVGKECKA
jgi:hypothetical protein